MCVRVRVCSCLCRCLCLCLCVCARVRVRALVAVVHPSTLPGTKSSAARSNVPVGPSPRANRVPAPALGIPRPFPQRSPLPPVPQVTPQRVARLLRQHFVVAVVRDRQELGPIPMGHRSVLAWPVRDLKARDMWPDPVRCLVPAHRVSEVVQEGDVQATCPSFALHPRPAARALYPELCVRPNCRVVPQTVLPQQDPWMYALLRSLGTSRRPPLLLNAGLPAVKNLQKTLEDLDQLPHVDYLVWEDYLFGRPWPGT